MVGLVCGVVVATFVLMTLCWLMKAFMGAWNGSYESVSETALLI